MSTNDLGVDDMDDELEHAAGLTSFADSVVRLSDPVLERFRSPPRNVVASMTEAEVSLIDPRLFESPNCCTSCSVGCRMVCSSLPYVFRSKKLHRVFCFHCVLVVVAMLLSVLGTSAAANFETQARLGMTTVNETEVLRIPLASYVSFWVIAGLGYGVVALGLLILRVEERFFFYIHRELALRTLEAMTDPHYIPRSCVLCEGCNCCADGCCPEPPPPYSSFHHRLCWGGLLELTLLFGLVLLTFWIPPLCVFVMILFFGLCAIKPVTLMSSQGWWANHDFFRKQPGLVLGIGLGAFLVALIPYFGIVSIYVSEVAAIRAYFHLLKVEFDKGGNFEIPEGEFSNTLQRDDTAQLEDWDQLPGRSGNLEVDDDDDLAVSSSDESTDDL